MLEALPALTSALAVVCYARDELEQTVYPVPEEIDKDIAYLKLKAMGIEIDVLTPEQARYLASWEEGT